MVELSGGYLNEENIILMLKAYQKELPLTEKELWMLPEMLGLCLLERIIEVSEEIIRIIKIKNKAYKFVKSKASLLEDTVDITPLLCKIDHDCKENASFHSHVIYLLKNMSVGDEAVQRYIKFHYKREGKYLNPSELFIQEGRLESLLESSIRTLIVSLREVNQIDEESLFEELSLLEHILSKDPANVYPNMDSESRSLYRGVVEKLAYRYSKSEEKVANTCLRLASEQHVNINCNNHVGTYLIGKGYPLLRNAIRNKPEPRIVKSGGNIKGRVYFVIGATILVSSLLLLLFIIHYFEGRKNIFLDVLLLFISLPMLISISQEIANKLVGKFVPVHKFPAMDYSNEIPDSARTFVVMPVILSSKEQGFDYLERLEKYYLANSHNNLYYALLVDYSDATERTLPEDEIIRVELIRRTKELNEKYYEEHMRFSLFIRYRSWNSSEDCYMGWERKRGKLEEFNALLYGVQKDETCFSTTVFDKELLGTYKYVITLDADSNLIRDNAAKMVSLIDHPLNRAVIDPSNKKVIDGYAIIQPSVKNHIVDKESGAFTRLFSGQTGISSYSTVVSDIYQDVFKQGNFVGKGIYNIEALHLLLYKTIPENSVLSHDLLESCYARTGFTSSVSIMDSFPTSIISYAKREHRWIRGDWQLLPWMVKKKNLSGLSRWKIMDNLGRSLIPVSKLLFIFMNLCYLQRFYYLWIPFIFFTDIINLLFFIVSIGIHKLKRPKLAIIHKNVRKEINSIILRMLIELVLIPFKAYYSLDAILRTIYRLYVSKKSLLKWKTSESVEDSMQNTQKGYFLQMWPGMLMAVFLVVLLFNIRITLVGIAIYLDLALIWMIAPLIAYSISYRKDINKELDNLDPEGILDDTVRRIWHFFKDFTTPENNWLCPDNYQEANKEKVSDKTSPTNIGLQLLSILSARDFGFETLSTMMDFTENVLYTIAVMPKWKGHLYNWYNIKTLEVLNPQYISTVDSGNYFGDIIALKNGLREQVTSPVISEAMMNELRKLIDLSQCGLMLEESYTTYGEQRAGLKDLEDKLAYCDKKAWDEQNYIKDIIYIIQLLEQEIIDFELEDIPLQEKPTLAMLHEKDQKYASSLIERIDGLCASIDYLVEQVDFASLYNNKRMLFHIGYHVTSITIDAGCYDLMASESSLTSFLAIARGEVPVKHWYKLGRPLTMIRGVPSFVSWSGTMFEYLMPNLLLKEYEGSVFHDSAKGAVLEQMRYGKNNNIPWGISESQYFRFDLDSNYQYRAFGVPQLRLQPSMSRSLVVTPYATMLALDYAKEDAIANLKKMKDLMAYGKYGFYEAIDFNGPDPVNMTPYCIVKSFMAHHQGMSMIAINNYLNNGIMRNRFHSEPIVKATEILLEEKRQTNFISISNSGYTVAIAKADIAEADIISHRFVNTVAPAIPVANYISNNTYSLMITSDGDGFSNYNGMMLYRWRSDVYENNGNYIYIKDVKENKFWSSTYHPTCVKPEEYQAIFSSYQAEFKRKDGDIRTHTVVTISPNKNYEIRKLNFTNYGDEEKKLEITSYIEVVGDTFLAELSHPAFNKLFIESEFLEANSIFLSRRRSNQSGGNPYLMHMVKGGLGVDKDKMIEYENDRLRFIGRNNTLSYPDAVDSMSLSNSTGFSNDPIMSIRIQIILKPKEKTSISFITGVCSSKEEAVKISEELSVDYRIDNVMENFRQQSMMELRYLDITRQQVNAFQELISPIYYPNVNYRGPEENIRRNWKNQSFLWKFGVSGDNPIMLLRVNSVEEVGIIKDVLKAYEYFRINQVKVDLIILSESKHGYMQELMDLLNDMISSLKIYDEDRERPSLFILKSYQMIPAEIDLLFTVARIVFTGKTGIYFRNIREKIIDTIMK
jgi:hypothetical protein